MGVEADIFSKYITVSGKQLRILLVCRVQENMLWIENKVRMGHKIFEGSALKTYVVENTAQMWIHFLQTKLLLILFSISTVYLLKAQISRDCQPQNFF